MISLTSVDSKAINSGDATLSSNYGGLLKGERQSLVMFKVMQQQQSSSILHHTSNGTTTSTNLLNNTINIIATLSYHAHSGSLPLNLSRCGKEHFDRGKTSIISRI